MRIVISINLLLFFFIPPIQIRESLCIPHAFPEVCLFSYYKFDDQTRRAPHVPLIVWRKIKEAASVEKRDTEEEGG